MIFFIKGMLKAILKSVKLIAADIPKLINSWTYVCTNNNTITLPARRENLYIAKLESIKVHRTKYLIIERKRRGNCTIGVSKMAESSEFEVSKIFNINPFQMANLTKGHWQTVQDCKLFSHFSPKIFKTDIFRHF